MSAITDKLNRLNLVKNSIHRYMSEILAANADSVEQLNQEQLSRGQRADGSILPDYSPTSVNSFGKPPGPIKLFDTGDFYEGIKEEVNDSSLTLFGTDQKTGMLEARYGEVIGLTEASKQELINAILKPELIVKVRKEL